MRFWAPGWSRTSSAGPPGQPGWLALSGWPVASLAGQAGVMAGQEWPPGGRMPPPRSYHRRWVMWYKQGWAVSMISDHRYRLLLIETTHRDYSYGDYYYWLWRQPNPGHWGFVKLLKPVEIIKSLQSFQITANYGNY